MSERYGATEDEWNMLDLGLGLTSDLLPVVSNPTAKISKNSLIKSIGKIPSVYNGYRKVVGIPDWTRYNATSEDISSWQKEPDYGICIQTRYVRALDIDVEDPNKSIKIVAYIENYIGRPLPLRYRENSGKCLIAFRLPGEFSKRSMKVDGGVIEFLANGQQFIAFGTHSSGVKYQWKKGSLGDAPEMTSNSFGKLWH